MQAAASDHAPGSIDHEPGSIDHEPGSIGHESGSIDHESGSINHEPGLRCGTMGRVSLEQLNRIKNDFEGISFYHGKADPKRQMLLQLCERLTYAMSECQTKLHHLESSMQSLVKAIDLRADNNDLVLFKSDQIDLTKQINKAATICRELVSHEHSLQLCSRYRAQKIQSLRSTLADVTLDNQALQPLLDDNEPTPMPSPSALRPATPEHPPLLADYYSKAGDVKVMQERLWNLDLEHGEEHIRRNVRRDQDEEVEVSDEEFESRHLESYRSATKELQDAINARHIARNKCDEAGIDPDELPATNPPLNMPLLIDEDLTTLPQTAPLTVPEGLPRLSRASSGSSSHASGKVNIEKWLSHANLDQSLRQTSQSLPGNQTSRPLLLRKVSRTSSTLSAPLSGQTISGNRQHVSLQKFLREHRLDPMEFSEQHQAGENRPEEQQPRNGEQEIVLHLSGTHQPQPGPNGHEQKLEEN